MKRKTYLQLGIVLIAGTIVAILAIVAYVLFLGFVMFRPELMNPITAKVMSEFQARMVKMMVSRRPNAKSSNVG